MKQWGGSIIPVLADVAKTIAEPFQEALRKRAARCRQTGALAPPLRRAVVRARQKRDGMSAQALPAEQSPRRLFVNAMSTETMACPYHRSQAVSVARPLTRHRSRLGIQSMPRIVDCQV